MLRVIRLLAFLAMIPGATWTAPSAEAQEEFLLITRDAIVDRVTLIEISESTVIGRDADGRMRRFELSECIGALNQSASIRSSDEPGLVVLTSGERLSGSTGRVGNQSANELVWRHRDLGTIQIKLEDIAWAAFEADARRPAAGNADVVILSNGDRIEGFVTAIDDRLHIEQEEAVLHIDLDRVRAFRLVNPEKPAASRRQRLWLSDGSVIDVDSLRLRDDGFWAFQYSAGRGEQDFSPRLVAGVLFRPDDLLSLASLEPHDVVGPPTRYIVPPPSVDQQPAALDLKPITLSGPITLRYNLPAGPRRFSATARLARSALTWGDCEIIVRDDDREVFRERLHGRRSSVAIAADLIGAELTIEVAEGQYGPIQDIVVLDHAMLISVVE